MIMGQKYAVFDAQGFPKAFYDDEINTSIPQEAIPISEQQWREFIENQGFRKWNFKTNKIEVYTPPLPTLQEAQTRKQKELLALQKQRIQNTLDQYGYLSLGDIQFYTNQATPDQEAVALLNWYSAYDDLIWQYIDNDLAAFTSVDELLQIDMKNIEQQIYEQSITTSPLP